MKINQEYNAIIQADLNSGLDIENDIEQMSEFELEDLYNQLMDEAAIEQVMIAERNARAIEDTTVQSNDCPF